ncbi:MAG: 50S ribosomal protein L21e [Candidatus Woesearchaeota archaeon]
MKRIGGARRKTRHIFQSKVREKGKISIRRYLQSFEKDQKVLLLAQPAIQNGMYFRRFHAKMGKIAGKQGDCYKVAIVDGGQQKTLIVHPAHLRVV